MLQGNTSELCWTFLVLAPMWEMRQRWTGKRGFWQEGVKVSWRWRRVEGSSSWCITSCSHWVAPLGGSGCLSPGSGNHSIGRHHHFHTSTYRHLHPHLEPLLNPCPTENNPSCDFLTSICHIFWGACCHFYACRQAVSSIFCTPA